MAQAIRIESADKPKLTEQQFHTMIFNLCLVGGVATGFLGYWALMEANAWLLANSALRMTGG